MRQENIFVVLGFDMETDMGSWSPYWEGLKKGTPFILDLLKRKGIEGTFFFTGEAAKLYPEIVKMVLNSGQEVGCHSLFHETVGDQIFDIPGVKPLLPSEVKNRLKLATEWVKKASGVKPVSFRCPRLWGSTAVVNALEKLGYIADVSYPLYYYTQRVIPYHPSSKDWTKEGNLKILEIPNFADLSIKSRDKYGRDRDQWPLYRVKSADALMKHIKGFVQYVSARNLPVVLCFYFHPWEFVKQPGSFTYGEGTVMPFEFLSRNCGAYARKQIEKLIGNLLKIKARFYSAGHLARVWISKGARE
ncbi:hypothetical protein AUJ66_01085 [Candidatus Desantisbacteria bacterium CG1_02_38_46]|uniref:NodB homology domain-containing protein n=3 Tax=unclassified Candidatus Desantisiibacteriota TaxID=3106372 RepID=A0A2H9PET7_9BACT|nr:MAG: hypothetical protein AUJ66_01085 [Candidatus Desantisbacteria bacterium CG1_02_38_46]PIU52143.1 MAG: hypothetical protein COS91_00770 [Candidatus Desantisbacteria bacterium CG07_land_8_20_14_0_80_39_15]PIZ17415.1 MAG: hypothetical protein COY51_00170 [Candidatus Desantisbacteria bacterium CG_4_10_14_0_8_um_filter_39_17]